MSVRPTSTDALTTTIAGAAAQTFTAPPEAIVTNWIEAANAHDPERFLRFFTETAVLHDPSVGNRFEGLKGIEEYYRDYFIGYNTQTRLVAVTPTPEHLHVEVHFTGDFPGGQTGGIFDITFTAGRISYVHADLA